MKEETTEAVEDTHSKEEGPMLGTGPLGDVRGGGGGGGARRFIISIIFMSSLLDELSRVISLAGKDVENKSQPVCRKLKSWLIFEWFTHLLCIYLIQYIMNIKI